MANDPDIYAWIGVDEHSKDDTDIGLKQAIAPAGIIPLVSVKRANVDWPDFLRQMQMQADLFGKPIRLVRYVPTETVVTLKPRPQG